MTDIETVAKLLGWEKSDPFPKFEDSPYDWYRKVAAELKDNPLEGSYIGVCQQHGHVLFRHVRISDYPNHDWPMPDDYNTIRRVEDVLAAKALWAKYETELRRLTLIDAGCEGIEEVAPTLFLLLRATAAQRIAAAAKVLREVG